jgi:Predicted ATPase with chaperone activity
MTDPAQACGRAPACGRDYMARVSGPLMDRFDLRLEVPPVSVSDLHTPAGGESSAAVAARVAQARARQAARYAGTAARTNADIDGRHLMEIVALDHEGNDLMQRAAETLGLTARGYHRVLRVARTIADLDGAEAVRRPHLAEALGYRLISARAA